MLSLERAVARAVLPLDEGTSTEVSGTRIQIVRIIRHATGCTLLVRSSHVEPLLSLPSSAHPMYALRNRDREEAAVGDVRWITGTAPGATLRFATIEWRTAGRGFVLDQYEVVFPSFRRPDQPAINLDAAWLAEAELVVLEMEPAGRISRTVSVDGFRLSP